MNINPAVWGDHWWFVNYTIAFSYPNNPTNKDKNETKELLLLLNRRAPCSMCTKNFEEHLKKYPLTEDRLESKNKLVSWVIDINNDVNRVIGKSPVTYKEIEKKYMKIYYSNKKTDFYKKVCLTIVIILILLCLFKRFS